MKCVITCAIKAPEFGVLGRALSSSGRLAGQVNGEGGSDSSLGMEVQGSAGLLDQSFDNGQPQAGALPDWFGGEIGIKHLRDDLRRNTRPIVAYRHSQERRLVVKSVPVQE